METYILPISYLFLLRYSLSMENSLDSNLLFHLTQFFKDLSPALNNLFTAMNAVAEKHVLAEQ